MAVSHAIAYLLARLDQQRQAVRVVMEEGFQVAHAVLDPVRRGRDVTRVARPGAADPVLGAAELARLLVGTAPAFQKDGVNLLDQA